MRALILVGLVMTTACGSRPTRPTGPPPEYEEPVPDASATAAPSPSPSAVPAPTASTVPSAAR
jgi:hypothetical protein